MPDVMDHHPEAWDEESFARSIGEFAIGMSRRGLPELGGFAVVVSYLCSRCRRCVTAVTVAQEVHVCPNCGNRDASPAPRFRRHGELNEDVLSHVLLDTAATLEGAAAPFPDSMKCLSAATPQVQALCVAYAAQYAAKVLKSVDERARALCAQGLGGGVVVCDVPQASVEEGG